MLQKKRVWVLRLLNLHSALCICNFHKIILERIVNLELLLKTLQYALSSCLRSQKYCGMRVLGAIVINGISGDLHLLIVRIMLQTQC